MKNRSLKYLASALIVIGLGACTQPEIPQDHYYRLDVAPPKAVGIKLDGVLEVERFRADGLISGRPIVYQKEAGRLREYHYHFWVEPPVDLLQNAMVEYLRGAQIAAHVVTPELRMNEDYLLTGKIKRLERDLRENEKVVIEMELGLKRISDDKILVLKTYERESIQQGPGVNGAVQAMTDAVERIYADFLSDVN